MFMLKIRYYALRLVSLNIYFYDVFLNKNRLKKGIWKIIVVVNNYFLLFLLTKKGSKDYMENDTNVK